MNRIVNMQTMMKACIEDELEKEGGSYLQLQRRSGLSRQMIARFLRGDTNLTLERADVFLQGVGLTVNEFFENYKVEEKE